MDIAAWIRPAVCGTLLALACCLASGASGAPATLPLTFEAIDAFGADSQSILSLAQDRQGFIWVGTIESGLFRYDGRGATKYVNDPANPASVPGGRVSALFCDAQGRLWIGSDEGLARYDPLTNSFTRYTPPASGDNQRIIRRIIADGAQGLWLATWGGLQHFDPDSGIFQVYQADPLQPEAIAHNDINAVALDAQGGVWAATWPAGLDYRPAGKSAFMHLRLDSPEHPDARLNDVPAPTWACTVSNASCRAPWRRRASRRRISCAAWAPRRRAGCGWAWTTAWRCSIPPRTSCCASTPPIRPGPER